jgi:hypothetical protein
MQQKASFQTYKTNYKRLHPSSFCLNIHGLSQMLPLLCLSFHIQTKAFPSSPFHKHRTISSYFCRTQYRISDNAPPHISLSIPSLNTPRQFHIHCFLAKPESLLEKCISSTIKIYLQKKKHFPVSKVTNIKVK